ncbi:MAG TPA: polysaccharide biosynthesis/export family protein [Daejeonella sp.]|nr:polysaccharide biosynthesis/export family protein [Daejeonella sp.]
MKSLYTSFLICLILFSSCGAQRNLVYFSESTPKFSPKTNDPAPAFAGAEIKVQPNDLLKISVTSLSAESNALFNPPTNGSVNVGYKVDRQGMINFPVLGQVKLEGLTLEQAQLKMASELNKYVKDPIVNAQFLNFKITVIGEVNRPSSFTIDNEKVNLLEALGMAGDMTVFGKRENVLVIRENGAERTMARVNLNKREVLNSPYFYLKQNDIVYVEPVKSKNTQNVRNSVIFPIISTTVSLAAIMVQVLRYSR